MQTFIIDRLFSMFWVIFSRFNHVLNITYFPSMTSLKRSKFQYQATPHICSDKDRHIPTTGQHWCTGKIPSTSHSAKWVNFEQIDVD